MHTSKTIAAFAIVAMTSLIPYNLFMNAHQYIYYKLRNATDFSSSNDSSLLDDILAADRNQSSLSLGSQPTTDLQRAYEGWFTLTSNIACILGSLVNTLGTDSLSNSFRVITGHVIVLLSLMPAILYTFMDTDNAGIQGLAATYSKTHINVVIIGQSIAGITTCLMSIFCQAATENAILNGRVYFGIAFTWTIVSVICYLFVIRSAHAKDRIDDCDPLVNEDEEDEEPEETQHPEDIQALHSRSLCDRCTHILQQCGPDMATALFVILVSCAAFPALCSQVRTQTHSATWRAYFSSVCCFLLYSCADGLGRTRRQLQNLALARLLLLPLIAACDVQPRWHSPTLIRNDYIFVLLNMSLALSNGFCYTHAYVKAVQSVETHLRETAGSMMSLAGNTVGTIGCMLGVVIVTLM
ncbi:hypothetical protein PRIPAC_89555 [Pristionchus pacificus]|uniref:Uncharacterized protein n=1 Tax=Pristionchus pacificus TaxID=54126 RepID=A0A2A6CYE3_PRIPA|nr:hypothetical protein PRIPAC_89555 [Pristionchus pacificus]|eukprot:PDM83087.1 hypothetical protein PRIPAC_37480 [Pristionchus pacificus]